ncbi:phospholipase D/nuclease [Microthyrium microscopicum]|uniref:Phospholipase D/nuclease n=1 Tax=Microthyrium microscopicum TaxID=703497 RepID=A0A6A6UH75_9PEZI|nr:phospholipase D/nuclease [Microthyrium microscopicum]
MADTINSDDDEDLKLAIALSLQDAESSATSTEKNAQSTSAEISSFLSSKPITSSTRIEPVKPPITFGGINLDRKKMEDERLARQAQRKRAADSDGEPVVPSKKARVLPWLDNATAVSIQPANIPQPTQLPHQIKPDQSTSNATSTSIPTIKHPKGAVFRTKSARHPRGRDISIEEVLQRDFLETALISSFSFNLEWLFGKLNTRKTKLMLCMAAKTEAQRKQYAEEALEVGKGSIKCCFPPMEGETNSMHSKLMILKYEQSLRIVVTSANMELYDWGETGDMENTVFLIDLPRLAGDAQTEADLTPFGKELIYFATKCNMPESVTKALLKFNFAATSDIALVHSVGGFSFGSDMRRTGLNSLAISIHQLGLVPPKNTSIELHYATASLGALNDNYLTALHNAASGVLADSSTRAKTKADKGIREFVCVYFPTRQTVAASIGGTDSAGTICLQRKWYQQDTFPRSVMRDHVPTRTGILSHSKIILGHCKNSGPAWAYIGSANLSESAWGKVVKDSKKKEMKMVCRNWECGVLLRVRKAKDTTSATTKEDGLRILFDPTLDIPFEIPGRGYGQQQPWFFPHQM